MAAFSLEKKKKVSNILHRIYIGSRLDLCSSTALLLRRCTDAQKINVPKKFRQMIQTNFGGILLQHNMCRQIRGKSLIFSYIRVKKITVYTEILTRKVDFRIFFTSEKNMQKFQCRK